KDADYRVIIAKYDNLPKNYKSKFSVDKLKNRGCLRLVYSKNKYTLIITALDDEMLQKATRFIANTELMTETKKPVKYVSSKTATYMSSLHYDGSYQLTNQGATLTGSGHHEETFFVALPASQSN
ncbi:cellulose synthase, partial [Lactobacillus salivarius]|nr:cellulose synthase [Ligilactobacillus salivarius]